MSTTYSKSSFDRFGDDLCSVLLSYLPLKDKFQYECVCSQWQRTAFQRVHKFSIKLTAKLFSFHPFDPKPLEDLLKKCPNITTFYMKSQFPNQYILPRHKCQLNCKHTECIMGLVLQYCPNLRSIDTSVLWTNEMLARHFFQANGEQLTSLVCYDFENPDKIDCKQLKNLRRLNINHMHNIGRRLFNESDPPDFPIKGLTHLKIVCNEVEAESIRTIIRCNKRLKYVHFKAYDCRPITLELVLTELSKQLQLKELTLKLFDCEYSDLTFKGLQELGKNCKNLLKLVIIDRNVRKSTEPSIMISLFHSMKYFPDLQHLELGNELVPPELNKPEHPILLLKYCKNLRHLKLSLKQLRDTFFTNIAKHLPNLCYLWIDGSKPTEAIVDHIKHLKSLETLVVEDTDYHSDNRISCEKFDLLYKVCPRLKSIHLRNEDEPPPLVGPDTDY